MILLLKSYPYHFVRTILSVPFCPIPFCPYTILSIPFCPYHFVRYHFVLEPLQGSGIGREVRLVPLQTGQQSPSGDPIQLHRDNDGHWTGSQKVSPSWQMHVVQSSNFHVSPCDRIVPLCNQIGLEPYRIDRYHLW